jgi:hypothetical protein
MAGRNSPPCYYNFVDCALASFHDGMWSQRSCSGLGRPNSQGSLHGMAPLRMGTRRTFAPNITRVGITVGKATAGISFFF